MQFAIIRKSEAQYAENGELQTLVFEAHSVPLWGWDQPIIQRSKISRFSALHRDQIIQKNALLTDEYRFATAGPTKQPRLRAATISGGG